MPEKCERTAKAPFFPSSLTHGCCSPNFSPAGSKFFPELFVQAFPPPPPPPLPSSCLFVCMIFFSSHELSSFPSGVQPGLPLVSPTPFLLFPPALRSRTLIASKGGRSHWTLLYSQFFLVTYRQELYKDQNSRHTKGLA